MIVLFLKPQNFKPVFEHCDAALFDCNLSKILFFCIVPNFQSELWIEKSLKGVCDTSILVISKKWLVYCVHIKLFYIFITNKITKYLDEFKLFNEILKSLNTY